MTRWVAIKIIVGMFGIIMLGTMLITVGIIDSYYNPYTPSPNMVTPRPIPGPPVK